MSFNVHDIPLGYLKTVTQPDGVGDKNGGNRMFEVTFKGKGDSKESGHTPASVVVHLSGKTPAEHKEQDAGAYARIMQEFVRR